MIEHLRIGPLRGLPVTDLFNVGRVNVFCGRNNSGKSTVLEAIHTQGMCLVGRPGGDSLLEALASPIRDALAATSRGRQYEKALNTILSKLLSSRRVWFPNDEEQFLTSLQQALTKDSTWRGINPSLTTALMAFRRAMTAPVETILIPAKRRLDTQIGMSIAPEPNPTGPGILAHLFYLKNQYLEAAETRQYTALANAFTDITEGFAFDIAAEATGHLKLAFRTPSGKSLPADNCGLGMQDLLIILLFALRAGDRLLLIEEPENHLHPDLQRRLLRFLRRETPTQYFLATHSNIFLDNAFVDRVLRTQFSEVISLEDETSRAAILDDLGYSIVDNLLADLVILVEGPKDIPFVEEFLHKYDLLPRYSIKLWPLGGDIMDQIDLSVLSERAVLTALIDKDPGSAPVRRRFLTRCSELGIPVHVTERRAIENYYVLPAIRAALGAQVPATVSEIPPDANAEEVLGLSLKRNARKIAKAMTVSDLDGTDLKNFFDGLKPLLQRSGPRN